MGDFMELLDALKNISNTLPKQMEVIKTEEATKNALIMPFIQALGYNIFDPTEVVPEFTADVGTKKGEKVDYAIMIDNKPVMLFECKTINSELDRNHASQLYRYFSTTEARFGILTNGIIYNFYTDIEKPNTLDEKPFLELNLLELTETSVNELNKFIKSTFDLDEILSSASELKYTREIKKILSKELEDPSEEFVRYFAKKVYPGPVTSNVREKFEVITKRALNQFIKEQVSSRLKSALDASDEKSQEHVEKVEETPKDRIITTEEEKEGFYVIKGILCEIVDIDRVTMRDTISYCGILLDNNNRKPICRLHFNTTQKYLGVFDGNKKEEKIPIDEIKDLYKHSDKIKARVKIMEE